MKHTAKSFVALALGCASLIVAAGSAQAQGKLEAAALAVNLGEKLYDRLSNVDRGVVITIENRTGKTLTWAGVFEVSGSVTDFTEVIPPQQAGAVIAKKSQGSVGTGAVGVLRYRLGNESRVLEVMYQVPYDYNLYSNLFNGNIVDSTSGPTKGRFDANYKHAYYAGKDVPTEQDKGYEFSMSMTNKGQSNLKVTIRQ